MRLDKIICSIIIYSQQLHGIYVKLPHRVVVLHCVRFVAEQTVGVESVLSVKPSKVTTIRGPSEQRPHAASTAAACQSCRGRAHVQPVSSPGIYRMWRNRHFLPKYPRLHSGPGGSGFLKLLLINSDSDSGEQFHRLV